MICVPYWIRATRLVRLQRVSLRPRSRASRGRPSFPVSSLSTNVVVAGHLIARVDFAFPAAKVAVEADGYRWHSGRAQWQQDLERRNALTNLGWRVRPRDVGRPEKASGDRRSGRAGIARGPLLSLQPQRLRDVRAEDLARSFVQPLRAHFAPEALDAHLGHEPVAAVDLDRPIGDAPDPLRRHPPCRRRLAPSVRAVVDPGGHLVHQAARALELAPRVDHVALHVLVLTDRLAEGRARPSVFEHAVEQVLRDPERRRRDVQPPAVDPLHRGVEALTLFAQDVRRGHFHVVKSQLGGKVDRRRRTRQARDFEPRPALLDDERRDPAARALLDCGNGEDDGEVGFSAVRDEVLATVQDVRTVLLFRARADLRRVRTRLRFGQREAHLFLRAHQWFQVALPKVLRRHAEDRRRPLDRRQHTAARREERSVPVHLFVDQDLTEVREPRSAELLRHVQLIEADLRRLPADLLLLFLAVRDRAGLLQLLRVLRFYRLDFALDEVADRLAQLDQLGRDLDRAHGSSYARSFSTGPMYPSCSR